MSMIRYHTHTQKKTREQKHKQRGGTAETLLRLAGIIKVLTAFRDTTLIGVC